MDAMRRVKDFSPLECDTCRRCAVRGDVDEIVRRKPARA
jgi:hypothetical protein